MGLTYITLSDTADTDPDLVKRFLKATMKGFSYALENPEKTVDIVLKFAPEEDREHQAFMLQTELTDAVSKATDQGGLGAMTDAQWKALYDHLIRYEALPEPFDYKTAFTGQFLEEVYDGASLNWP